MCLSFLRDVDGLVMMSQEEEKRVKSDVSADNGGPSGGTKSDGVNKIRVFKAPEHEDKIKELSYKNFAIESKRKIR